VVDSRRSGTGRPPTKTWLSHLLSADRAAVALVAIFLGLALVTFVTWQLGNRYPVTGDEPHYLVTARSITAYHTFELTAAYRDEFRTRAIFAPGLADREAKPGPGNTHAVAGSHGLYNIHNVGLPLLIAVPFAAGGTVAVKLFMIALSGSIVLLGWAVSGEFARSRTARALAVAATTIAQPFIPASSQIYPDLLAGIICLAGLYWLMTMKRARPLPIQAAYALAIGWLPWLHIKLAAPAAILTLAAAFLLRARRRESAVLLIVPALALMLALYNWYAFGHVTGPYQEGALQLSKTALMVFFGLLFDQNQGFLLQNPALLVGVFFLAPFLARNAVVGLAFVLVLGSLVLPNAMHGNWYAGYSFSGRFGWSAAVVALAPALYGYLRVFAASRAAFGALVASSLVLQAVFFVIYTFSSADLYRAPSETWLDAYSLFYRPVQQWLPALYNVEWAFFYAPNFVFFAVCLALLAAGLVIHLRPGFFSAARGALVAGGLALAIVAAGFVPCDHCRPGVTIFPASSLLSQTGSPEGTDRVVKPTTDKPGFLSVGPYIRLPAGRYRLQIFYTAEAPAGASVAHWSVTANDGTETRTLTQGDLPGLPAHVLTAQFESTGRPTSRYGFEIVWGGEFAVRLKGMRLSRALDSQGYAAPRREPLASGDAGVEAKTPYDVVFESSAVNSEAAGFR